MTKKKNLVVANWKMNPETQDEAKKIFNSTRLVAKTLKNTEIVICAPFVYTSTLSKLDKPKNLFVGVQNISSELKGAFTGEISGGMAKNVGAKFAIIGHSERRATGETNEMIAKKIETAFAIGLTPILCIGEKERNKDGSHLEFIKTQIKACLTGVQKKNLVGLTIAYEPVWAIGKSYRDAMTPTDVHEMTLFIKKVAGELLGRDIADSFRILYGGSIESGNDDEMMARGNVSGFLVGHASISLEQFPKILKAVDAKK